MHPIGSEYPEFWKRHVRLVFSPSIQSISLKPVPLSPVSIIFALPSTPLQARNPSHSGPLPFLPSIYLISHRSLSVLLPQYDSKPPSSTLPAHLRAFDFIAEIAPLMAPSLSLSGFIFYIFHAVLFVLWLLLLFYILKYLQSYNKVGAIIQRLFLPELFANCYRPNASSATSRELLPINGVFICQQKACHQNQIITFGILLTFNLKTPFKC